MQFVVGWFVLFVCLPDERKLFTGSLNTFKNFNIYIYLIKVANLAVECSMPYKQNVV